MYYDVVWCIMMYYDVISWTIISWVENFHTTKNLLWADSFNFLNKVIAVSISQHRIDSIYVIFPMHAMLSLSPLIRDLPVTAGNRWEQVALWIRKILLTGAESAYHTTAPAAVNKTWVWIKDWVFRCRVRQILISWPVIELGGFPDWVKMLDD